LLLAPVSNRWNLIVHQRLGRRWQPLLKGRSMTDARLKTLAKYSLPLDSILKWLIWDATIRNLI
jgi:hypothetical protein